jgi:hypothetical protein
MIFAEMEDDLKGNSLQTVANNGIILLMFLFFTLSIAY